MSYLNSEDYSDYSLNETEQISEVAENKLAQATANFSSSTKQNFGLCTDNSDLKGFVANILMKNLPSKKVSENIGETFKLVGFHSEIVYFKSGGYGDFITLFGIHTVQENSSFVAYTSASAKIAEAVKKICIVYGEPEKWGENEIFVKIRSNSTEKGISYGLEVIKQ